MDPPRAPAGPSPASFPAHVGRYELLLPLASGGMATVYLARATGLCDFEREVAIKIMHPHLRGSAGFTLDLIEEAKLAVRIRHPNVVPVLDVDEDPFGVFLVMDYIEGDTLGGLLQSAESRGAALPTGIGLRILVDALGGLHAAHELRDTEGRQVGLVHRDFSPQNILVGVDGTSKLADFGVAKAATRLGHTQTGTLKGKFAYMSPEQARAQELDRRCDVWAAGVIAWEIVAQRRLHEAGNDASTLLQIVSREAPRLRQVRPDTPAALDEAVSRALAMDLRRRCPTAWALARQITDACSRGFELAETAEVAEYVTRVVGPKLEERRARVAEMLDLRRKMATLAYPEGPEPGPAPTLTDAQMPFYGEGFGASPHDTLLEPAAALIAHNRAAAPISAPPPETTGTQTATVTTDTMGAFEPRPRHPVRRALAVLAVAIALAAITIAGWPRAPAPAADSAAGSETPPGAAMTAGPPGAPTLGGGPDPVAGGAAAERAERAESTSPARPLASGGAAVAPRGPQGSGQAKRAPSARATTKPSPLVPNPYPSGAK
jgi:serine/threonine-protein kinase